MKFPNFAERKRSLPFSQNRLTEPHFEPAECDPDPIFYLILICLMRTTCPVHLALLDLIGQLNICLVKSSIYEGPQHVFQSIDLSGSLSSVQIILFCN
jgi:hypothetical protein